MRFEECENENIICISGELRTRQYSRCWSVYGWCKNVCNVHKGAGCQDLPFKRSNLGDLVIMLDAIRWMKKIWFSELQSKLIRFACTSFFVIQNKALRIAKRGYVQARKQILSREAKVPDKAFPISGIEEMALRKKKTDDPKFATKKSRTRYSKKGAPFPSSGNPAKK